MHGAPPTGAARPQDGAIRAALERLVRSPSLRNSPQLITFLRFVVEAELDGRGAQIKGYTVAVDAFGRAPEFDPQADPIVRVEAARLRRALDNYYDGIGRDDPVRIAMPLGTYVPHFCDMDALPAEAADAVAAESAGPATLQLYLAPHAGKDVLRTAQTLTAVYHQEMTSLQYKLRSLHHEIAAVRATVEQARTLLARAGISAAAPVDGSMMAARRA